MSTRLWAGGLAVAAVAGLVFASVSTLDFVQHLDRQVHDLHCSFAPGLVEADEESTGCQVTLLSPYSSIMRTSLWGGIPISLPAMAVFAFLLFRAIEVVVAPVQRQRTMAGIALATTLVPVGASAVMGTIAFSELHAACKLCIGIYCCSGAALVMAGLAWLTARKAAVVATFDTDDDDSSPPKPRPSSALAWSSAAAQAFGFVTVPVVAYAMLMPDYSRYIGTCGALPQPEDPYEVMVYLDLPGKGPQSIEVFDPLCPACRGFEERLRASKLDVGLNRRGVLFPLDSECNWMVTRSLHPGACRVSEAVLCADKNDAVEVSAVVQWAFEQQEELTKTGKADLEAVTRTVAAQFPALADCLGSAEVKSRLNKSLRWTVNNQLPVMTPQLYVEGVKLCDEDSDLGLDFMLSQMLERHEAGTLKADVPASATPSEPGLVPGSEAPPTTDKPGKRRAGKSSKAGKASKSKDRAPGEVKASKPGSAESDEPGPAEAEEPKPEPTESDEPKPALPSVEELPPPAEEEEAP